MDRESLVPRPSVRPAEFGPTEDATGASVDQARGSELPPELASVVRTRLRLVLAPLVISLNLLIGYLWVAPKGSAAHSLLGAVWPLWIAMGIAVVGLALSYRGSWRPERLVTLGLGCEVAVALCLSLFRHGVPWHDGDGYREWSPVAVLVVSFAVLLPARPRTVLVVGLICAATEPLALAFGAARGLPVPPPHQLGILMMSALFAAGLGYVASRSTFGLGRRLEEARKLGRYELIERVGRGGMGEVWRARHQMLARPAAVKLIRPEALNADPDARDRIRRRFEREARTTAGLRSPHTVNVYDFGTTKDGTFYYVMEMLRGLDLDTLVRRFGPVRAPRATYLLMQACQSLSEAHRRMLIHRDVKPGNIFACRLAGACDFVKVLDFGLVKTPSDMEQTETVVTVPEAIPGTPAYIAPEIALGRDVDGRADLYALGCVAYFLVTGHSVFGGGTAVEMVIAHIEDTPVPPSKRTELALPPAFDELVMACLEKDPRNRPNTADELGAQLATIDAGEIWTPERARGWWEMHVPSAMADTIPERLVDTATIAADLHYRAEPKA